MKNVIFTLFLLLFINACALQRVKINEKTPNVSKKQATKIENHHFWFGGVGQSRNVDADEICQNKNGVQFVEVRRTSGNVWASIFTLGIYYPKQYSVYCNN